MSKADTWEAGLLDLLFKNVAFTLVGDAAGLLPSAAPGNLYISLHTSDPADAGDQTTNETAYTGYARQPCVRGAGFTRTGNSISPSANVDFPICSAAPGGAVTHFGVGTSVSGVGKLLYSGAISPNITLAVNVIPRLTTATAVTED